MHDADAADMAVFPRWQSLLGFLPSPSHESWTHVHAKTTTQSRCTIHKTGVHIIRISTAQDLYP